MVDALHRILNIISFHEHDYGAFGDSKLFYSLDRKKILEKKTHSDNAAINCSSVDMNKLSKIFEARLFSLAPSLHAYSNHNDLESRIRILAMQLGKKIESKQQDHAFYTSGKSRQQIIESKLGKPMVEEILALVLKVKTIQRMSFNNFLSREGNCTGRSCLGGSCLFLPKALSSKRLLVPGIPLAMKNIYLNTRLLDAFSKTNSAKTQESLLALLDAVQWSALIEEIKHNIYHFEMWEKSQEELKSARSSILL